MLCNLERSKFQVRTSYTGIFRTIFLLEKFSHNFSSAVYCCTLYNTYLLFANPQTCYFFSKNRKQMKDIKSAAKIFEVSGKNRDELAEHLLQAMLAPTDTGKPVPESKGKGKGRKKGHSSASGTGSKSKNVSSTATSKRRSSAASAADSSDSVSTSSSSSSSSSDTDSDSDDEEKEKKSKV